MTTKRYTDDQLVEAVRISYSVQGVMRELGIRMAGGSHYHISNRIKRAGLDTSHFTRQAHNKGKISPTRLTADEILVRLPEGSNKQKTYQLRRSLFEIGMTHECAECHQGPEWYGKPLQLEIDHIDGDNLNNCWENLRWLCPNCHSQMAFTNMPHKYRKLAPVA